MSHVEEVKMTQSEGLRLGAILLVGGVAIVVFLLGVWWASRILDVNTQRFAPGGPARSPTELGKAEIGIVNQRLFELENEAARLRAQQLGRLNGYGWVDRDAGVVHVPIEQAMEAIVRENAR